MRWAFIHFTVLSLLLALPVWAEPNERPLKEIVTYQEFTDLLKHNVNKIPDLQELWQWQRRTKKHIYFGGGVLRGLMHWTYKQLQNHSIEEVKKMPVPSIANLQLQKGSDIDLFAPDDVVKQIKREVPKYKDWDILADSFHAGNVKLGGPTIEKARINPNYFDDPLGGIKDYYNGILRYHWTPESEFRNLYWVKQRGNTKATEALRLLRFSYNLPELEIDEDSLENIKKISNLEMNLITKSKENNWWLEKSLKKLHYATGENPSETLDALRKGNLLSLMAAHRYLIPGNINIANHVDDLAKRGFSIGEMKYAEKATSNNVDHSIAFMNRAAAHINNAKEFDILTSPIEKKPSDEYLAATKKWRNENYQILFKHKPNLDQIIALLKECSDINLCIKMRDLALPHIKSANDFMAISSVNIEKPNEAYIKAVKDWRLKNADQLFEYKPNLDQIIALIKECSTIDQCIKMRDLALPHIKSANDYLLLSSINRERPHEAYVKAVNEWKFKNTDPFFARNPTKNEILAILKDCTTIQICLEMRSKSLSNLKSPQEFLQLAEMERANPSQAYIESLDKWKADNAKVFFESKPTQSQFNLLNKSIRTKDISAQLAAIANKYPPLENDCQVFFARLFQ